MRELPEPRGVGPWVLEACPTVLPPGWEVYEELMDGRKYINRMLTMAVIMSGQVELDGRRWLHLSVSHRARLLRWHELVEVKEIFLGIACDAYQVIPRRSRYIDIHPHVLHLFHCLDGDPLPDFTNGAGSL